MSNGVTAQLDPSKVFIWKFGRPAELWLSHHELVAKVIAKYKLKPLSADNYPYLPHVEEFGVSVLSKATSKQAKAVPTIRWPIPFPGGMRIPHFHYGRDVYLLKPNQWNEFSKMVVKDIQSRIAGANEVGFEQVMELEQAVSSLSR